MTVSSVLHQALRRLFHHGLIRGWSAWHAHWEAKCYAYARLHALLEQQRALEVALSTAREGAQAEASQLVAEASLQASAIESR